MIGIKTNTNTHICSLKLSSYTETGHQAGQVDVAWSEHVQLLQT